MRRSLYLREDMDDDILKIIKPLLKKQSFAHVIRELVRDGVKYRKGATVHREVIQSVTPSPVVGSKPLLNAKIVKKEVNNNDIATRLDSF